MWPDVEAELVAWMTAAIDVRHLTDLPANLVDALPLNQLQRIGGDDDGLRLDRALVSVDSFAATRQAAWQLALETRYQLLFNLRGAKTANAVFSRVATIAAPAWRPYENTGLRRVGATYEIYCHPVA